MEDRRRFAGSDRGGVTVDVPPFPNLNADASLSVSNQSVSFSVDSKVFEPETNKIETTGRIRRKTFLIVCDGKGHMDFRHLADPLKAVRQLRKLADEGMISEEDFEHKKRELLDRV